MMKKSKDLNSEIDKAEMQTLTDSLEMMIQESEDPIGFFDEEVTDEDIKEGVDTINKFRKNAGLDPFDSSIPPREVLASLKRELENLKNGASEESKSTENKLPYKEWLEKYFDKDVDHNYWTSIYEKVEVGFAPQDMSRYRQDDLKETYDEYVNGTNDFLKYEE